MMTLFAFPMVYFINKKKKQRKEDWFNKRERNSNSIIVFCYIPERFEDVFLRPLHSLSFDAF